MTAPGSAQGLELVVDDIETAQGDLRRHGAEVSEVFHSNGSKRSPGPDPEHRSYQSLASFSDPDGNGWLVQEVTTRLPVSVAMRKSPCVAGWMSPLVAS
jgi:hypothetical protein